jgi:hypothetical protein
MDAIASGDLDAASGAVASVLLRSENAVILASVVRDSARRTYSREERRRTSHRAGLIGNAERRGAWAHPPFEGGVSDRRGAPPA